LLKVALNTININRKSIDWLLFNVKWARFQLYSWRENIYKQWIWYVNRLHWNGTVDEIEIVSAKRWYVLDMVETV
jgi:hypothetical protein